MITTKERYGKQDELAYVKNEKELRTMMVIQASIRSVSRHLSHITSKILGASDYMVATGLRSNPPR